MAKIILLAHAPLASAMQAVAMHTHPECTRQLRALDVDAGAGPEHVEAQLQRAADELGDGELLVLVDVFGATPCNAALRFAERSRARVVAGLNVPMLWRTLCYAGEPIDRLVTRAVDGAQHGVLQVSAPRRQNQAQPPHSHAQDDDSHQQ